MTDAYIGIKNMEGQYYREGREGREGQPCPQSCGDWIRVTSVCLLEFTIGILWFLIAF